MIEFLYSVSRRGRPPGLSYSVKVQFHPPVIRFSYEIQHNISNSLFQAPREMREGECEGTKTRGDSPSRISLGAWNRLHF